MTHTNISKAINWGAMGGEYTGDHPSLSRDWVYWVGQDAGEWRAQYGADDGAGNFYDVQRNHDIPLTSSEEAKAACQAHADECVSDMLSDKAVIILAPAEIQSGLNRVRWAEGLIRQLPEHHEGRNSWLLNHATKEA
jgi:hypothetical protein